MRVRDASPADVPQLHALLRQLAEFEHLEHRFVSTEADLHAALFGQSAAKIHALVAQATEESPLLGYVFYYFSYGTFSGRSNLHIEDLYVVPEARGSGLGLQLFQAVQAMAKAENCQQMEWLVLNWNEKAIAFYEASGAEKDTEWQRFVLPL